MLKRTAIILSLFLFIASCNKTNQPKFIDKHSDELVKYVIDLSGSNIIEYSKYVNNEFVELSIFYNSDTVIEVVRSNANGDVSLKSIYRLSLDGLAESSVDSIFSGNGLEIYQSEYQYNNGFWIERNSLYTSVEGDPVEVLITRIIENENVTSSKTVTPSGCTNRYTYNNEINKIDLNFSNGITGKWSKNLVTHILWRYGCPCGPSSSIAISDYSYEIDNNGYVTKRVEIYTPCYHITDPGEVTRTISTTIYEYNMN